MSDEVVETVREWLAKASSDWLAIEILSGHSDCPRETVCFHCQQYVEKLLKALLTLHGIEAPRTHFLRRLIQLSSPLASNLSQFADRADSLSAHAVQTRRPDDWREVGESEMRKAPVKTGARQWVQVPCEKGVANHSAPSHAPVAARAWAKR